MKSNFITSNCNSHCIYVSIIYMYIVTYQCTYINDESVSFSIDELCIRHHSIILILILFYCFLICCIKIFTMKPLLVKYLKSHNLLSDNLRTVVSFQNAFVTIPALTLNIIFINYSC